jgi:hypothetical protein
VFLLHRDNTLLFKINQIFHRIAYIDVQKQQILHCFHSYSIQILPYMFDSIHTERLIYHVYNLCPIGQCSPTVTVVRIQ